MARSKSLTEALERHKPDISYEFFTLADDRDRATVRFLYGDFNELDWTVAHNVDVEGKKRWVRCTEEEDCPLCKATGKNPQLKLFIQMVVKGREDVVGIWERGQTYIPKLQALFDEYGDLRNHIFEIERFGKKGDDKTTYKITHSVESPVGEDQLLDRVTLEGETKDFLIMDLPQADLEVIAENLNNFKQLENPAARSRGNQGAGEAGGSYGSNEGVEVF